MATLTPTLTLSCTDLTSDATNFTITQGLTVTATAASIQKISTGANPLNAGVGVLITEANAEDLTTFVYLKHTGKLASDGTTNCHASNDFIVVANHDGVTNFIKLQPGEFCFFPMMPFTSGSSAAGDPGGLKVEGGGVGSGGAAHVMVEFAYWTRS